ncbi:MAG TPA: ADP-ribosylglycohydrolase family protein [Planctomycetota bacterium]|nr:ADP-ribosylglycohydrolase family protein [Planctomycetota bacterium]
MLGALVGDIVGSVYEWSNHRSKTFPLFSPACIFTDDSVLTVALAESILDGSDYAVVMRAYGRRYPSAGYGGMYRRWLLNPALGPYGSFGNGAAMRISPAGWAFDTLEETLDRALLYTAVTHDHPEGIKGAQAVAGAIWLARHRATKDELRTWVERTAGYDLSRTCDEIRPGYRFNESCQKTVPEALVAFLESTDFEDAIRNGVSLGGDSDTLTCITGSVAEAFYGGVPAGIEREAVARLDDPLRDTLRRFRDRFRNR